VECEREGVAYVLDLIVDGTHIKAISEFPELKYEPSNIAFKCRSHHNAERDNEEW